ncbi:hypothetical protein [Francisella uliginis]|uniref:Uncharacterized protein n=1 Tax=Francisella uliginis TaxID=573570 RepID=A0A1L4BPS5_9GAMM|nr:hypothetical protein [Francisella uliginis]API85850.1 hypothetical protein F7310_00095 [Francisella uliginis]
MLYKQIHILRNFFETKSRQDKNYIFSLDTFVDSDETSGILMVELDSIIEYIGINETIDNLVAGIKFLQYNFTYKKQLVNGYEKTFICIDYLNAYLVQILNYLHRNSLDDSKLISLIENLDNLILNTWDNDVLQIRKVFESLNITYKPEEYKYDGYLDSMTGLIKTFSSRV